MKNFFLTAAFLLSLAVLPAYAFIVDSLNILAPMRVLDIELIKKFEQANSCIVKVEFMADRTGYESHLRSDIKIFDVVIGPEEALIALTTAGLLRTLPIQLQQNERDASPLSVKTQFNSELNTYVPIFVDPMGIAYNKNVSKIPKNPTWSLLVEPEKNPFWRQHIYFSKDYDAQLLLAKLFAHTTLTPPRNLNAGARLPSKVAQLMAKLHAQRTLIDEPLEVMFLGHYVNAAVLFYSDYLRYKHVVSNLDFIIPTDGTYFERIGIAWPLSSVQEKLSQKFIEFMIANAKQFTATNHLFDIKADQILGMDPAAAKARDNNTMRPPAQEESINPQASWMLYDESSVLPFVPAQGVGRG